MPPYTFTYTVHTVAGNPDREKLAKNIHEYMRPYLKPLGTPTITLTNKEGCLSWLNANLDFNLDVEGYSNKYFAKSLVTYSSNRRNKWKYGEIGVWASNFLAWKEFINSPEDCLILFEDDLILEKDFFSTLLSYMDELPEDWDAFYMYVDPSSYKDYKPFEHDINKDHVCRSYQDWSNACYVINKKTVSKLYSEIQTKAIDLPVDWHILKRPEIFNSYAVTPSSYVPCRLAKLKSSFQEHQKRIDIENE